MPSVWGGLHPLGPPGTPHRIFAHLLSPTASTLQPWVISTALPPLTSYPKNTAKYLLIYLPHFFLSPIPPFLDNIMFITVSI